MGFGRTSGVSWYALYGLAQRVAELEKRIRGQKADAGKLREAAAVKLKQGGLLTREEVAAHLGVSTKKVQRLEAKGQLVRCPNLGAVVRYRASDVLRLASA